MKLKLKEAELFVDIVNSLIELMPQDEYYFDDHAIGYDEDGLITDAEGKEDITDTLDWVLTEVIPYAVKENLLKEALERNEDE